MPTFCRHNRLLQNCPICAREQAVELRPVVSSSAPRASEPAGRPVTAGGAGARTSGGSSRGTRTAGARAAGRASGLRVRRLARGPDDGYRCQLVAGLRSSVDALRLVEELAFATARLRTLAVDPPGLYAEVSGRTAAEGPEAGQQAAGAEGDDAGRLEERTWLAFLIALLGPLEGRDPFAELTRVRTSWSSGRPPSLAGVQAGPRGALADGGDERTVEGYRAWAARSGSQAVGLRGDGSWTALRRFSRAYERLALPGFPRAARFEFLTLLGATGAYELEAGALALGGSDPVTLAAKRVLGIGETMLLERRAAELAAACGVPLAALDVGLFNWERGERARLGMPEVVEADPEVVARGRAALRLD